MAATDRDIRIALDAPAKINLFLHVVGRRDDGYHLLDSTVAFAGVGDTLYASASEGLSLKIFGPFAETLIGDMEENIVLRAARALRDAAAVTGGAMLSLDKRLPVASGIGGGSADAAAALRLLAHLWSLPDEATVGLAIGLGADVPVCLRSASSRVGGIGDAVEPLNSLPACGVVLVNAGEGISTPAVFAARSDGFSNSAVWRSPSSYSDFIELLRETRNDLTDAALSISPSIGDVLAALKRTQGCDITRLSGSGGTCFALYETADAASAAAEALTADRPEWWVRATQFMGTAPSIREGHLSAQIRALRRKCL